jgi:hypothetical protein
VHLDHLAHERIAEAHQAQHGLARRQVAGRPARLREDAFDHLPLTGDAGTGEVPRAAERPRLVEERRHHRSDVGHVHELVRPIDRPDEPGSPSLDGGQEGVGEKAAFDIRPVEVGQAENGGPDRAGGVGGEDQVLLLLPHAALIGVRLARMALGDALGPRPAEGIHRADEEQPAHALRHGPVEHLAHHDRVLRELPVGHADEMHGGVETARRRPHRLGAAGIPGDDLRQRIGAEGRLQRGAIAADHAIGNGTRAERRRDTLPDRARCPEETDPVHRELLPARSTAAPSPREVNGRQPWWFAWEGSSARVEA